ANRGVRRRDSPRPRSARERSAPARRAGTRGGASAGRASCRLQRATLPQPGEEIEHALGVLLRLVVGTVERGTEEALQDLRHRFRGAAEEEKPCGIALQPCDQVATEPACR